MSRGIYLAPEESRGQRFFYQSPFGRVLLSLLIRPALSRLAGRFLDSRLSCSLIPRFIRKNHISMEEVEPRKFLSFNDFFTRQLKENARPIDSDPFALISPCDCRLSVFPIEKDSRFFIKGSHYTVSSLLQTKKWDEYLEGGYCAIFRLTVSDYHRYCYFDSGTKGENVFLPGVLHTVNPISTQGIPIYQTNCREYSLLETEHFGPVIQMEVGALLVGRILNYHQEHRFSRGEEKGRFEFGGSTVVLLFPKGRIRWEEGLTEQSAQGLERIVKLGEKVGEKA